MIKENIKELEITGLLKYVGIKPKEDRVPVFVFLDDPSYPDNWLVDHEKNDLDNHLKVEVPFEEHNDTKKNHARVMVRVAHEILTNIIGDVSDFRIICLNYFGDRENSIKWILDNQNDIDVINCSFSAPLANCIDEIKNLGIPIVCATGNNSHSVNYPAMLPEVIAITAYEADNKKIADYANYGKEVYTSGVTDIYVYTDKARKVLVKANGTSTATPMIGIMILVYNLIHGVKLSTEEAKKLIKDNCVDLGELGRDNKTGYGLFVLPDPLIEEKEVSELNNSMFKNGIYQGSNILGTPFYVDLVPETSEEVKASKPMTPKFKVVHNTGNTAPTATDTANNNYMKNNDFKLWHFTVDEDSITQGFSIYRSGFHAGYGNISGGDGNSAGIGVEICVNGNVEKAISNAFKLFYILDKEIDTVMKPHFYFSGKHCPAWILDNWGWSTFESKYNSFRKMMDSETLVVNTPHWCEDIFNELTTKINVLEKRFDDPITRGEAFKLSNEILKYCAQLVKDIK